MLGPLLCTVRSIMLDRTEADLGLNLALVSIGTAACNGSTLLREKGDIHFYANTFQESIYKSEVEIIKSC